jgi:PKD repeat protein
MKYLSNFFILLNLITLIGIKNIDAQNIIWSEDFTNGIPTGWDIVDNTSNNFVWSLQSAGTLPETPYTINQPTISSTSGGNSMLLYGESYNTPASNGGDIDMDSYFQTAAIPVSNLSGVSVNFQQSFRRCCGTTPYPQVVLSVSTDSSFTNPTEYDIIGGVAANILSADPMNMSFNISAVAANYTGNIYLRWHMKSGVSYYFWMIDDIALVESELNDIITNTASYAFNGIRYTRIPANHVQSADFSMAYSVDGSANQTGSKLTVDINNGTTSVFNQNTTPTTLNSLSNDTLELNGAWTPPTSPLNTPYTIKLSITSDSTDVTPANNEYTFNPIEVTANIMAIDTYSPTHGSSGAPNSSGGTTEYEAGNTFKAFVDDELYGIQLVTGSGTPTGTFIDVALYEVNYIGANTVYTELARSDIYSTMSGDIGVAKDFLLTEDPAGIHLTAGRTYFAAVHSFVDYEYATSGSGSTQGSATIIQSIISTPNMASPNANSTYSLTAPPMIRLNFDQALIAPCNLNTSFVSTDNGNGNFSFSSTVTDSNGTESYSWDFGDSTSSTLANPNHAYTNSGSYITTLTVTDSANCTATYNDSISVTINTPCNLTTSFTTVDNGNGNFSFTSTLTNSGGGASYNWNFGDSTSSTLANPNHTYTNSGSYITTLAVTDSANCTATYSDNLSVSLASSCNYFVSATDSNGTDGYFYTNAWPSASNYLWDFGDGNTSTNPGPIHTYAAAGTYSYCVTIDNCPAICDTITITNSTPCNVTSNFSAVDNGNGNYTFANTSTGNLTFTSWSFGDGNSSNDLNPTHAFLANGTYTIVLYSALIDNNLFGGCSDYQTVTINVTGVINPVPCQAGVSMFTNPLNYNQIIVVNSSIGNTLTYFWDFGDGNTSTLAHPVHFYGGNGPYYFCVTIDDGNGCSSTYCDSIGYSGIVLKTGGFSINTEAPPLVTTVSTEQQTVSEFKVYPNPFKNNVIIELNLTEATLTEVFVTDLIGNNIAQLNNTVLNTGDNKLVWKATNIANGVYLLNIKTANGLKVEKLILNK